jgi:hypothetical protein
MTDADLNSWWEITNPHEDVRKGELPESVFAIDLGAVANGEAPRVYQDPVEFYDKTHTTSVLEDLLVDVVETIGGHPSGNRVQRLQTGFGGGKTHLLLSVYHLINSPEEVQGIDKVQGILEESHIDGVPDASTAVIVGTDLDIGGGRSVGGIDILTPWGELAYQLGGSEAYEFVQESDQKRVSPGKDNIVDVFNEAGPSVILIDELLQYVLRARGIEVGGGTLGEQAISFVDELVKAVGSVDNVYAIISLQASERYEMFGDPEEAEGILNQIESKVERVDSVTRPIEKSEIHDIIRERLFDSVGNGSEHSEVAESYVDYYEQNSTDFPDEMIEPGYKEKIVQSYPFHPDFINTLYDQWGSMPDFQRTRGVLRFLAKVVSDQYKQQQSRPLIQPGQLNMSDSSVRDEVLDYLEEGWDSVVESDIAGENSKAAQIDQELGGIWHNEKITRSTAATIFLYSHGGGQQSGATLDRIRSGVLRPNMETALVPDAVTRCEESLYFLHESDDMYRFSKKANLNRVVSDYAGNVDKEEREREIREAMDDILGGSCFTAHIWPVESDEIPDDDKIRLCVMSLDESLDSGNTDTMEVLEHLWENYGEEYRSYKNSMLFLCPSESDVSDVREAAIKKVALKSIRNNQSQLNELTDSQQDELQDRFESAKSNLPTELRDAYSQAVIPSEGGLERIKLDSAIVSSDENIDERLENRLREDDKLLSDISPNLIISDRWGVWPKEEDESGEEIRGDHITTQGLWEHFNQLPGLPMLESEKTLKKSIRKGVDDVGKIGYATLEEDGYENLRFEESIKVDRIEISDDTVLVLESVARDALLDEEESEDEGDEEKDEETEVEEVTSFGDDEDSDESTEDDDQEKIGPVHGVEDVSVDISPNWETEWDDTFESVIEPLAKMGADISLEVGVDASSEEGLDKSKIERQIEENLTQRGIEYEIEYDEE